MNNELKQLEQRLEESLLSIEQLRKKKTIEQRFFVWMIEHPRYGVVFEYDQPFPGQLGTKIYRDGVPICGFVSDSVGHAENKMLAYLMNLDH